MKKWQSADYRQSFFGLLCITSAAFIKYWFDEFDAQRWDHSLAADVNDGKLDSLAAEALAHYSAGQCKPL